MSSTDRAPEPTMEEILASIRRIISEEENNHPSDAAAGAAGEDDAFEQTAARQEAGAVEEGYISTAPASAQPDDAEFPAEPIEDLTEAIEPEKDAFAEDDEVLELGDLSASAPEEPAPAMTEAAVDAPPAGETGFEDSVPEAEAAQDPEGEDEPLELSEDVAFPFKQEEQEDAGEPGVPGASSLEAAIAALRNDQARASAELETAEQAELEPLGERQADEPSVESALQGAAEEDEAAEQEPSDPSADPDDDDSLAEDAAAFPGAHAGERRNGAGARGGPDDLAYAAAAGPLEETVKAMLRPMLREWLDQNMDRLLQEALHEELQAEARQRRN